MGRQLVSLLEEVGYELEAIIDSGWNLSQEVLKKLL